jgi:predicted transcriptional regulator
MSVLAETQTNAKAMLRQVIDAQPEDASYEEIMRELAFERMVDRGLADVRAGRFLEHDAAIRRIRSWRS